MLQVQCVKVPVREGRMAEVRAWMEGLSGRRSEVLDALVSEGIADETVFLGVEGDRSFLYLYSRATSFAAAAEAVRPFRRRHLQVWFTPRSRCRGERAAAQDLAGLLNPLYSRHAEPERNMSQ